MNYGNAILRGIRNRRAVTCRYCGTATMSFGEMAFCSNCELAVKREDKKAEHADIGISTADALERINALCGQGSYKDADALYQGIIKDNSDPAFLYTYGLFCIKYSNFELSKVSYSREGFMEENIDHREESSKIYSRAKTLLYKCIDSIKRDKEIDQLRGKYVSFLSMIKLGRRRSAEIELKKIRDIDGDVYDYASIVFDSYSEGFDSVIKSAEEDISKGKFQNNVPFYLAFALFKKGRFRESMRIAEIMDKNIPSQRYNDLISDIKKAVNVD